MNIFQQIKALFRVRSTVNEVIKEAKLQTESGTPGWKTTEFYFQIATQIGTLWGAIHGFIPAKYEAIIAVVGVSIYNIGRVVAKAVADIQAAKAGSTTVTTTAPVTTVTTP